MWFCQDQEKMIWLNDIPQARYWKAFSSVITLIFLVFQLVLLLQLWDFSDTFISPSLLLVLPGFRAFSRLIWILTIAVNFLCSALPSCILLFTLRLEWSTLFIWCFSDGSPRDLRMKCQTLRMASQAFHAVWSLCNFFLHPFYFLRICLWLACCPLPLDLCRWCFFCFMFPKLTVGQVVSDYSAPLLILS